MARKRGNGEGSVYKRGDGQWVASISLEKGGRKVYYGKTKKEVTDKLIKARREQQQGMLIATKKQTVGEYLKQWLQTHKPTVRIRTYERYEELIRLHISPAIGHIQLQKLTLQHIQVMYAKLGETLSSTTVNTLHAMLHKALDDAVKWEIIARNVSDLVTPPRRSYYEIQVLTEEQAKVLLDAAKGHSLEALWVMALTTGMRRGELLALKWQDIDFTHDTVQVRRIFTRAPGNRYIESEPKTEKSRRSILLAPITTDILKQHRARQLAAKADAGRFWEERNLVFCTSLGTPLNPSKVLERFKTLLKRAGLPIIRFHDLRHSAASMLLAMRVHPKIVQELLGHNQISMTMDIYSHLLPSMQEEIADKFNEAFKRGDDEQDNEDDDGMAGTRVPIKPKK